jgi:ABC-type amino acid transport substrate-binding protein
MRLWKTILIFFILISSLSGNHTKTQKTIYVASEPDYPPFCIVDKKGKADGFSVDLFKEVAAAMNLKIKFKVDSWHKIKLELELEE